jgi:predicted transcriptional regulator
MTSTTLSIRVDGGAKRRLEKLAKSTGRSSSYLAAEAIDAYLDVNEWQVAGIKKAMASLEAGKAVAHEDVKAWVASWGKRRERPRPKPGKP